jgi:hypothetical protein
MSDVSMSPGGSGGFLRRLRSGRRIAIGVAMAAVVALVVSVVVVSRPHNDMTAGRSPRHATPRTVSSTTLVVKKNRPTAPVCPLTGTVAPNHKVPQRPALGVKIGNDPASRPQSGLLDADIVFDEMAEGGITRYLAIFQCHEAPVLGPIRSVRWDDWHVLASYGHPILAFSGGIDQWDAAVAAQKWLFDANGSIMPTAAAYYRTSNRVPPWNYYTSTRALWALDHSHTPPPRQFTYSITPPKGATKAASVTIDNFDTDASGITNLTWTWSPKLKVWLRSYGGVPDVDASGRQLRATNVVVWIARAIRGPYAESGTTPDVESITEGSGTAYVFRNGLVERGTWSRPSYGDVPEFRFGDGKTMTLNPGNTWVELVPSAGYPVRITP